MKTARSQQFSHRNSSRGFSLIEIATVMLVAGVAGIITLNLLNTFFGGAQLSQSVAVNNRFQIESIGAAVRKAAAPATRTFLFTGTLKNPDGTVYVGTRLTLGKRVDAIVDSSDFLSTSGLTLTPAGSADRQCIVAVGDPLTPLLVIRESHVRTDGFTSVSLTAMGSTTLQQATFVADTSNSAAQTTAAVGSAGTAADGHVFMILPNPLALWTARMPVTMTGTRIDFPNLPSRTYP